MSNEIIIMLWVLGTGLALAGLGVLITRDPKDQKDERDKNR